MYIAPKYSPVLLLRQPERFKWILEIRELSELNELNDGFENKSMNTEQLLLYGYLRLLI